MTIIFLCQKINAFRVTNNFAYIFAQSRLLKSNLSFPLQSKAFFENGIEFADTSMLYLIRYLC